MRLVTRALSQRKQRKWQIIRLANMVTPLEGGPPIDRSKWSCPYKMAENKWVTGAISPL